MGNTIYPDSQTRKMFGQAGAKAAAQARRFNHLLQAERTKLIQDQYKATQAMKDKISAFQKLPWYRKLWILIMELFGRKIEIL